MVWVDAGRRRLVRLVWVDAGGWRLVRLVWVDAGGWRLVGGRTKEAVGVLCIVLGVAVSSVVVKD